MRCARVVSCLFALLLSSTTIAATAPLRDGATLLPLLKAIAPDVGPEALARALEARDCAQESEAVRAAERLAVIDYTLPSTKPRLWVFDLREARLLYVEHVAHGRNSGENFATHFSNENGSHQSSLGLHLTGGTYVGANGYSLLLDGLEPGINDASRKRAIVIHGAAYVDPDQALRQGRLGRSFGCPALRTVIAKEVIDVLKDGQLLFAYYPDPALLRGSRLLGCAARSGAVRGP